jgi:hypothetical protein
MRYVRVYSLAEWVAATLCITSQTPWNLRGLECIKSYDKCISYHIYGLRMKEVYSSQRLQQPFLLVPEHFGQQDVRCLLSDSIYSNLVVRGKWLRYLS